MISKKLSSRANAWLGFLTLVVILAVLLDLGVLGGSTKRYRVVRDRRV